MSPLGSGGWRVCASVETIPFQNVAFHCSIYDVLYSTLTFSVDTKGGAAVMNKSWRGRQNTWLICRNLAHALLSIPSTFTCPLPYYRSTLSISPCTTYLHADECDVDRISGSIKVVAYTADRCRTETTVVKKHILLGHIHISWVNNSAWGKERKTQIVHNCTVDLSPPAVNPVPF